MEEIQRETMPVDVLFVGGGPAGLAGAYHLANLIEKHNQAIDAGTTPGRRLDGVNIMLIEKGASLGPHGISGCILNPKSLEELIPHYEEEGCPIDARVKQDVM